MGAKKVRSSSAKPDTTETKLRAALARMESKRDRWKKRAVEAEAATGRLETRLKVVERRLRKAKTSKKSDPSAAPASLTEVPAAPDQRASSTAESAKQSARPDAGWTVAELRAEARRRGIAGMSRKAKADLLAALV